MCNHLTLLSCNICPIHCSSECLQEGVPANQHCWEINGRSTQCTVHGLQPGEVYQIEVVGHYVPAKTNTARLHPTVHLQQKPLEGVTLQLVSSNLKGVETLLSLLVKNNHVMNSFPLCLTTYPPRTNLIFSEGVVSLKIALDENKKRTCW